MGINFSECFHNIIALKNSRHCSGFFQQKKIKFSQSRRPKLGSKLQVVH